MWEPNILAIVDKPCQRIVKMCNNQIGLTLQYHPIYKEVIIFIDLLYYRPL